jgi:hypothetical protein
MGNKKRQRTAALFTLEARRMLDEKAQNASESLKFKRLKAKGVVCTDTNTPK